MARPPDPLARLIAKQSTDLPHPVANFENAERRLVEAAWKLLSTTDVTELSLREVARNVGLTAPAAYHWFQTKEGLLAAVAEAGFRTLNEEVRKATPRDADPFGSLARAAHAWVAFAHRRPQVFSLMVAPRFASGQWPRLEEARTYAQGELTDLVLRALNVNPNRPVSDKVRAKRFEPSTAWAVLRLIHGTASLQAAGADPEELSFLGGALEALIADGKRKRK